MHGMAKNNDKMQMHSRTYSLHTVKHDKCNLIIRGYESDLIMRIKQDYRG